MRQRCMPLVHHFEGIGETSTHYLDLASAEAPPTQPERTRSGRLAAKMRFEFGSVPFALGFKKPGAGFRSLGRAPSEVL
jgi:hypothetical protein